MKRNAREGSEQKYNEEAMDKITSISVLWGLQNTWSVWHPVLAYYLLFTANVRCEWRCDVKRVQVALTTV